jgi:AcrR family transcriptional regulator
MNLCKIQMEKLIIDHAKDRFDRFGYKKTTMDEISKDCHISKKTIYVYFKDKEHLFHSLLWYESHKAQSYILAKTQESDDPVEQLKILIKTTVEYFNQNCFLIRLLNNEQALYPTAFQKKYRQEVEEALVPLIVEILTQGKKNGKIRDVDVSSIAYAGLKMFQCYMQTRDLEQETKNLGCSVTVLIDLLMQGLLRNESISM